VSGDRRTYDPGVTPLLLAVIGALALGAAAVILRLFGPSYRVGRLLAVAPHVSISEAIELANTGADRYVRVDGRIDAEEEFEDEHHRPLVYRRTTLQAREQGRRWTTLDTATESVQFVVREGLEEIGVDVGGLREGLVVVPRIRRGQVGEIVHAPPPGAPREADGQAVIEQVSSVEHATVLGVPRRVSDGRVTMAAGLGRPLILTTLEQDEAMRVLTGGATARARAAVACLLVGIVLISIALTWWLVEQVLGSGTAVAAASSPDPSMRPGSDTRSTGQGPGIVGSPLLAIGGMVAIGIASIAATLAYVRLTGGRRDGDDRRPPSR
jgi:hypothetical protein